MLAFTPPQIWHSRKSNESEIAEGVTCLTPHQVLVNIQLFCRQGRARKHSVEHCPRTDLTTSCDEQFSFLMLPSLLSFYVDHVLCCVVVVSQWCKSIRRFALIILAPVTSRKDSSTSIYDGNNHILFDLFSFVVVSLAFVYVLCWRP